jgi:sulfur carrier protein
MQIHLNDHTTDIASGTSAGAFIELQLGGRPQGVALAINDEVLPRARWDAYQLQPDDRVLIVQAVQGG